MSPGRLTTTLGRAMMIVIISGWAMMATVLPVDAERSAPPETTSVITNVVPEFPTGLTFSAEIPLEPGSRVDGAALYYRIGSDETLNLEVVPAPDVVVDGDTARVTLFVDLQMSFVPLGVSLTYFWELSDKGDVALTTNDESTQWIDSRFDWDVYESDQVTIYTYDMDGGFAQWMLESSQATIDDLERKYELDAIEPIAIWIYTDSGDFAATRQVNTREAIAGLSYPGVSLVVAVIPDESEREYGRVVPHEISHQVLYHATENPYAFPPLWLDEGLATHYQTGGTGHYAAMVWRAQEEGVLFDITSLNTSFPFQPAQATLAYASSWSIIDYIEAAYGPEGITALIEAFADGLPVDDAIQQALGIPSDQLNADWHQWVTDQGNPE